MSQITTHRTAAQTGAVVTITGDTGGPISPNGAGNINLFDNTPTIYSTPGTNPFSIVGSGNTLTLTQNFQAVFLGTTIPGGTVDLFTITTTPDSAVILNVLLVGASAAYTEGFGGQIFSVITNFFDIVNVEFTNSSVDGEDPNITATFVVGPGIDPGPDYTFRIRGSDTLNYNWRALVTWQIENR